MPQKQDINLILATHETFRPYVGGRFEVQVGDETVELILDNVKIFEGSTVRDNHLEIDGVVYPPRKAFALTFVGPLDPELPSQEQVLSHAEIEPLRLFISPFRRDPDLMLYEATFN